MVSSLIGINLLFLSLASLLMPFIPQTHPDQFEFQHGLLEHPFGQMYLFNFTIQFSLDYFRTVCQEQY